MAKKRSASSARVKRVIKSDKYMPDSELDFSDTPELTDDEVKSGRRVGRPKTGHAKLLIAIRIDPRLLARLRKLADKLDKPYQTLIHELLERAAKQAA